MLLHYQLEFRFFLPSNRKVKKVIYCILYFRDYLSAGIDDCLYHNVQ